MGGGFQALGSWTVQGLGIRFGVRAWGLRVWSLRLDLQISEAMGQGKTAQTKALYTRAVPNKQIQEQNTESPASSRSHTVR